MATRISLCARAVITASFAIGACGPTPAPEAPRLPPPGAPPAVVAPLPSTAPSYTGLGVESVPAEILERFAPRALEPAISRRIQAMLDVRAPGVGRVGPDGSRLFFSWTVTGTRQVFRLDAPMGFPVQLTGGEDSTNVLDVTPDGTQLVLSRDRAGEENPGLYLQSTDGGPLVAIKHDKGVRTFLEVVSDDGKSLIFRANDRKKDAYTLYRYDLATRQSSVLFDQDGLWNVADSDASGKLLLAKEVGSNMAEIYELDPTTKAAVPLVGQGEREDYAAAFGAASGEVLVLTPKFGEFRRLYRFRASGWEGAKKGDARAVPLAADKRFLPVSAEIPHDVDEFAIDHARRRIYLSINDRGFTRLEVLDAKTYAPIALPKLPPGDHVRVGTLSRDGRFATVAVETGRSPGRAFVLDWKSRTATAWHVPSAPELETSSFADATLESYPARDGTQIPMLVRRPARCAVPEGAGADEPCPVIVHFHGGPEGQSRPGWSAWAQIFVGAGFVFVEPNVRGSDGYGKTWLHADDGEKRLAVLTDIEDCARFIRARWAKAGKAPRLGVFGGSYGGYAVQTAMTRFAGAYDVGVSVVGISNLLTFLRNTAPYRRILRVSEYGDPDKDAAVLLELSPTTHVDKVKGPILLVQGATDPRVPVGEALQLYQQLQSRGVPSELIIFSDEGHGAGKRSNQVLMIGHSVRFFEQHLLGRVAAPVQTKR